MHCVQGVKLILYNIIFCFNLLSEIVKNTVTPCVEILQEVSDANAKLVIMAK